MWARTSSTAKKRSRTSQTVVPTSMRAASAASTTSRRDATPIGRATATPRSTLPRADACEPRRATSFGAPTSARGRRRSCARRRSRRCAREARRVRARGFRARRVRAHRPREVGARGDRGFRGPPSEYGGGSTQYGLGANAFRLGPQLDVTYAERLHFGGGFDYARLIIQRKTSSDALDYGGLGVFALVAADFVRFEPCAVFLSVRASADAMTDRAVHTGISLASGIRF